MAGWLTTWIIPLLSVIAAVSVAFERPRRLWRPFMARASEWSPGVWLVLSLGALLAWAGAGWFAARILERTVKVPTELTPMSVLDHVFGFVTRGLTGTAADQLDMQAVIICGAIALVLGRVAVRMRHAMFELEIELLPDAPPRRVIVMGLSDPGAGGSDAIKALQAMRLTEATKADVGRFGWQQNLRVLQHHWRRGPFRRRSWMPGRQVSADDQTCHIVVLPSVQTAVHVPAFIELATACFAKEGVTSVTFHPWQLAVDYDDLVTLQSRFRGIVRWARTSPKIAANLADISIDTTAGFKVFSIAGAAATFSNPIEFTYVRTNAPFDVHAYDVQAILRPRRVGVR